MAAQAMDKWITLLPDFLGRYLVLEDLNKIDFIFSNVPVSETPVYMANRALKRVGVFGNMSYNWKLFLVATTYKGNLFLNFCANSQLEMDPQRLLDLVVENIEKDIRKSEHLKDE